MSLATDDAARGPSMTSGGAIPDPSNATVAMLLREVGALKELSSQRMDGIEKAIAVAHEDLVRVPTSVTMAVGALKELIHAEHQTLLERFRVHDEKFTSIQQQFAERDVRTEQTQKDSKVAVDAALQAAKEAVGAQQTSNDKAANKIADSTEKLIGQQAVLLASQTQGLGNRIDAVKETIGSLDKMIATIQQALLSRTENSKDSRDNLGAWVAGAVLLVAVVGLVMNRMG